MLHFPEIRDHCGLVQLPGLLSRVERTFDPAFLTTIANDPNVRPWLGGEGPLDLSAEIKNPANFAFVVDGGGFVLIRHEPGIYEAHSLFLPEARSGAAKAMRDGLSYMFTRTDCVKIVTQVPDDNAPAAALARLGRFSPMFRREDAPRGPTAFVGLSIDDWAMNTRDLETDGDWFHSAIERAKIEQNSSMPDHPHDPAHERAVGATVRMIKAGNIGKGVIFYNRWARLARYPLISLISAVPPVLDVGDAIATLNGDKMEVLLCR